LFSEKYSEDTHVGGGGGGGGEAKGGEGGGFGQARAVSEKKEEALGVLMSGVSVYERREGASVLFAAGVYIYPYIDTYR